MQKDFVRERGFVKFISPFKEVIEKKGWSLLYEHKPAGFAALVREFYANMVGKQEKTVYVRGKWISFDREAINKTFNLKELKDGSKLKKLKEKPNYHKIVELLTKKNPFESISRGSLTNEAKVWFYFLALVLLTSKHLSIVRQEETILLYEILKGYEINVGKVIENSILSYYQRKYRGLMPHPTTITRLYIIGKVEETWEEKEKCPRSSPLTLTGITRPLPSKEKGKAK